MARYFVVFRQKTQSHIHTQVSRGGILKVVSACFAAESAHSKLKLESLRKPGVEFDFNLTQKPFKKYANKTPASHVFGLNIVSM